MPLTTDADGKATFAVSAPPDQAPGTPGDKYRIAVTLLARDNAPPVDVTSGSENYSLGTPGTDVTVAPGGVVSVASVIFSTGDRVSTDADITVSVTPAAKHAAAPSRGAASNRATVTVTDVYGDPITGVKVTLTSNNASSSLITTGTTVPANQQFTVGRDGSYTFGYAYSGTVAVAEDLTGALVGYEPRQRRRYR